MIFLPAEVDATEQCHRIAVVGDDGPMAYDFGPSLAVLRALVPRGAPGRSPVAGSLDIGQVGACQPVATLRWDERGIDLTYPDNTRLMAGFLASGSGSKRDTISVPTKRHQSGKKRVGRLFTAAEAYCAALWEEVILRRYTWPACLQRADGRGCMVMKIDASKARWPAVLAWLPKALPRAASLFDADAPPLDELALETDGWPDDVVENNDVPLEDMAVNDYALLDETGDNTSEDEALFTGRARSSGQESFESLLGMSQDGASAVQEALLYAQPTLKERAVAAATETAAAVAAPPKEKKHKSKAVAAETAAAAPPKEKKRKSKAVGAAPETAAETAAAAPPKEKKRKSKAVGVAPETAAEVSLKDKKRKSKAVAVDAEAPAQEKPKKRKSKSVAAVAAAEAAVVTAEAVVAGVVTAEAVVAGVVVDVVPPPPAVAPKPYIAVFPPQDIFVGLPPIPGRRTFVIYNGSLLAAFRAHEAVVRARVGRVDVTRDECAAAWAAFEAAAFPPVAGPLPHVTPARMEALERYCHRYWVPQVLTLATLIEAHYLQDMSVPEVPLALTTWAPERAVVMRRLITAIRRCFSDSFVDYLCSSYFNAR
jgi:hypothetical protein